MNFIEHSTDFILQKIFELGRLAGIFTLEQKTIEEFEALKQEIERRIRYDILRGGEGRDDKKSKTYAF